MRHSIRVKLFTHLTQQTNISNNHHVLWGVQQNRKKKEALRGRLIEWVQSYFPQNVTQQASLALMPVRGSLSPRDSLSIFWEKVGLTWVAASLKSPKCNPAYPGINRRVPSCSTRITLCCLSSFPHILSILPLAPGCYRNKRVLGTCCKAKCLAATFFNLHGYTPVSQGTITIYIGLYAATHLARLSNWLEITSLFVCFRFFSLVFKKI